MEASTNKSPSPILTQPRPNPNSRNSETNSTIRRSFNGNPFARSLDFGRRKSLGYEEKENENRKSVARVSSPGKSKRNFMAPTISAASKFTPSPRKRVLAEKNDLISFSNNHKISFTKVTQSDLHSQMEADQNKIAGVKQDDVTCLQVASISDLKQDECIELPSNPENPSLSLSDLAEIDPDRPSLPPYDPTTNYLSPRPLFLRYKPNPRVEVFLNKQVLDFEEILESESLSSDETQSGDSPKESDDDAVSSVEIESNPDTEPSLVFSEPTYQSKIACKHKFFTTRPRKSISLLLVFLIACLCISVADSPVISSPVFDQTLYNSYDPFEAIEFARANFDGFVRNLKHWSSNTISYLSTTITHFRKSDELRKTVRFSNISASEKEVFLVDSYYFSDNKLNDNQEQNGLESVMKDEDSEIIEPLVEEQTEESPDNKDLKRIEVRSGLELQACDIELKQGELEEFVNVDNFQDESESNLEKEAFDNEVELNSEKEAADNEILTESNEFEPNLEEETLDSEISTDMADPKVTFDNEISTESNEFELNSEKEAADNEISTESTEFEPNLEEETLAFEISTEMADPKVLVEEKIWAHNAVLEFAASILVLGLIVAGSIFYYTKNQSKASTTDFAVDVVNKNIYEEKAETEVNESSTFSQMSSFETTRTIDEEASRRESLASSDFSMGSPSYGSFTTYERIPKHHHHGSGDEDIVTPVRRSSRIRSKVVSYS